MPSLRDLQQQFADAVLATPRASTEFIAGSPSIAGERLQVYRRTILANYRNALAATYPVVKRLVGAARFQSAVDSYVVAHRSTSGDLNIYGDRFGDFLERHPSFAELIYLGDVARLEWAIDEAHRAPDATRDPERVLAALAAAPAERLPAVRVHLDPSCRFVSSRFPILHIWKINQPNHAGDERVDLDEGGDALIVRRDPNGIALGRLAPGDHAWLTTLRDGASLSDAIEAAQAADATFDVGASLRAHIAGGTIVAVIV
jgi:hypothetical protein